MYISIARNDPRRMTENQLPVLVMLFITLAVVAADLLVE